MSIIPVTDIYVPNNHYRLKNSLYARTTSMNVLHVPFSKEGTSNAGTFLLSGNGNAASIPASRREASSDR